MNWFGFSLIDKALLFVLLVVLFFFAPWWITFGLAVVLAFWVPRFYVLILIGLLLDIVFIKTGGGPLSLSLPMTLTIVLACLLSVPLRERLM